jgi:hypothetical protein
MRPAYAKLSWRGKAGWNTPVVGRKFCIDCGRWRPIPDFDVVEQQGRISLRGRCQACRRIKQRVARAQRTAEQVALRREYERIYAEGQRRARGTPPRNWRHRPTVVDRLEYRFLPIAPLAAEIQRYVAHTEGDGYTAIARRAGTTERSVRRLVTGESAHVRLDLADRICLAMGTWLAFVYGDTPLISFEPPQAFQERWRRGTAA